MRHLLALPYSGNVSNCSFGARNKDQPASCIRMSEGRVMLVCSCMS